MINSTKTSSRAITKARRGKLASFKDVTNHESANRMLTELLHKTLTLLANEEDAAATPRRIHDSGQCFVAVSGVHAVRVQDCAARITHNPIDFVKRQQRSGEDGSCVLSLAMFEEHHADGESAIGARLILVGASTATDGPTHP